MLYRVILLKNGKYKKTLWRCQTRPTAFINFHRIKSENDILFPKRYINHKGIKEVDYKIAVVKNTEPGDEFRIIRNKFGKTVEEKPLGDWTILTDMEYELEESFWVYGYNALTERKSIIDIMGLLMYGMQDETLTKQIVVVKNKLLIYHGEQFDLVICKCEEDCQRLNHALAKAANDNSIKSLYFMGTARKKMLGDYYDIIHEHTKWSYTKIWRTTSRP